MTKLGYRLGNGVLVVDQEHLFVVIRPPRIDMSRDEESYILRLLAQVFGDQGSDLDGHGVQPGGICVKEGGAFKKYHAQRRNIRGDIRWQKPTKRT